MRNLYLWIGIVMLFAGCRPNTSPGTYLVSDTQEVSSRVNLSEVLSDYRFIPLETSPESLIGGMVMKLAKKSNRFYISFNVSKLLIFNNDGKFIRSVSAIGGGPGEYLQLLDFDVNDSLIALLDYKKIHFFSLEGVYENSVSIPCTGMNIKLLSDGNIAVRTSNESYSIYIVNREGKEISKHLETTHSSKLGRFNPFICHGDKIFLQEGAYSNRHWWYENGKTGQIDLLDHPDVLTLEQEEILVQQGGFDYTGNAGKGALKLRTPISSGKKFLFSAWQNDKAYLYMGDFSSGKTRQYLLSPSETLVDDITYGKQGYALVRTNVSASENSFISLLQPYVLAEALDEHADQAGTPTYDAARQLLDSLGDVDNANPILFEFNFK